MNSMIRKMIGKVVITLVLVLAVVNCRGIQIIKQPEIQASSTGNNKTYFIKGSFVQPQILGTFSRFDAEQVNGTVKCNVTKSDLSCTWALTDSSSPTAILSNSYIYFNEWWYTNNKTKPVYTPIDVPMFGMCGTIQAAEQWHLPYEDTYQPMRRNVPPAVPTWPKSPAVPKAVTSDYFWNHCKQLQTFRGKMRYQTLYGTANEKFQEVPGYGKNPFQVLIDVATGVHNATAYPITYVFHSPESSNYYIATNYTNRGYAVAFLESDSKP